MNQSRYYGEYLKRQKQAMSENTELEMARKATGAMSAPFSQSMEDYKDTLNRKNIPTAVAQELALEQSGEWAQRISALYQTAEAKMADRRAGQQAQIEETEMKYEMAKDQEEEQKSNFLLKAIPQLALSALGGVAGLTGLFGAEKGLTSALEFAQVGAGAGQMIGGMATQDWGMMAEGVSGTLSGISAASISYDQKEMNDLAGGIFEKIELMPTSPEKVEYMRELMMYKMSGDVGGLQSLFDLMNAKPEENKASAPQEMGSFAYQGGLS